MVQGNVSATVVDFTPFIHNEAWICGAFSLLGLNSSHIGHPNDFRHYHPYPSYYYHVLTSHRYATEVELMEKWKSQVD